MSNISCVNSYAAYVCVSRGEGEGEAPPKNILGSDLSSQTRYISIFDEKKKKHLCGIDILYRFYKLEESF